MKSTITLIIALLISPLFADDDIAVITNTVARAGTDGNIVDAHEGCLEFFEGRSYLYGTRYGEADGSTKANKYVCYSSDNLIIA